MSRNDKLMLKRFLLLAICILCPASTLADIIILRDMGNTIVPIETANVSMEAETVTVVPNMGGDAAKCKFYMKSHSDCTITSLVGFPINRPPWYPHFTVKVNGQDVPTSQNLTGSDGKNPMEQVLYYESDHSIGLDYPGFYTWMVEWKPYETVVIEVEYIAGVPGNIDGIVRGWRFEYIVRTGNFWHGPIGTAVISTEFRWNMVQRSGDLETTEVSERLSYPDNAKQELLDGNNLLITWQFNNWEPKEDIIFERYRWEGVDGIYATWLLPQDYLGASQLYDENYIDALTELEFKKARMYYPERADTTDRAPYRYAIANILKCEILARNGYSFSPYDLGNEWKASYFIRYKKLGWYDHQSASSLSDVMERMNEYEHENFEYLSGYLENHSQSAIDQ
jgi:hypothetical protein